MSNIDLFDEHAARIFAALYEAFPVRVSVAAADLLGFDVDPEDPVAEIPLSVQVYEATVQWLAEAGYIYLDGNATRGVATLTPKGLEVMKAVPETVRGHGSLGDALVAAVRSGGAAAGKELVSRGITEAYRLVTQGLL